MSQNGVGVIAPPPLIRATRPFEAMLWLRKGFGFAGRWTVSEIGRAPI